MVFTNAQTTAFFEDADQIGLSNRTRVEMQNEGVLTVDDLDDFEDSDWDKIVENLRRPPRLPDPVNPGQVIAQNPFVMGARSTKRLKIAAAAVRFYKATDRAIEHGMMKWSTLTNFEIQNKALSAKKQQTSPEVPKLGNNTIVHKWADSFLIFSGKIVGQRNTPLSYVLRESDVVPAAAPALAPNQPHSIEHGSMEQEMIERMSHNHALFRDDNASVYEFIEVATRGTKYQASIIPFRRTKNGRGAYKALLAQHAGPSVWDKLIKEEESFMKNRKWTGGTNVTLEKHLEMHRSAFINLSQAADHILYQLPNHRTRVTYLIDSIDCKDAEIQAALAQIRIDDPGMRDTFETAAAFLLPADPVAKRTKEAKRTIADISQATLGTTPLKSGTGQSGVEFRFYKQGEFSKLNEGQREELFQWRNSAQGKEIIKANKANRANGKGGGGKGGSGKKPSFKKPKGRSDLKGTIASLMKEAETKRDKAAQDESAQAEALRSVIASIMTEPTKSVKIAPSNDPAMLAAVKLQQIIKGGGKA